MMNKIIFIVIVLFISSSSSHIQMQNPPPRKSKFNHFVSEPDIDYNMMAPLFSDGSNFPCKHYSKDKTVATYIAGDTIQVTLFGTTIHNGGSCEFSISYDNERTFLVLYRVIRNCMLSGMSFSVPLPKSTPSCDSCVFSWSWSNAIGNRELYMNCADIKIANNEAIQYLQVPKMTVVNLPGYPTIPEYPPSSYDGSDIYLNAPIILYKKNSGVVKSKSTTTTSIIQQPKQTKQPKKPKKKTIHKKQKRPHRHNQHSSSSSSNIG